MTMFRSSASGNCPSGFENKTEATNIYRIRFCVVVLGTDAGWTARRMPITGTHEFILLSLCLYKADKSQGSRHIQCAVHLESLEILKSGRHDGACLLLLSVVSSWPL
jgi:hypothetical protein